MRSLLLSTRYSAAIIVAAAIGIACAGANVRPPFLPYAADTAFTKILRPGITRQFSYVKSGPWAIHVLEVDIDRCNRAIAAKGSSSAVGREKTSDLLRKLSSNRDVAGGVNADFFSLAAPPGVPTGLLITNGRVLAGPSEQPVLTFDASGAARIAVLHTAGFVVVHRTRIELTGWNRMAPNGVALFDDNWAATTDTASSVVEVVLSGGKPRRVVNIDTAHTGVAIPGGGVVLIAGRNAPAATRATLLALQVNDTLSTSVALVPTHPREAVGGRPQLLRDSVILGAVDTEGQPGFATGRHPRTAAGIARGGKRLILVVIDGRQAPYSDGMTLRELAVLMRSLGARDAINLDGGGSTTFVYSPRDSTSVLRIGNRPSDPAGERTVGDALAIVRTCR